MLVNESGGDYHGDEARRAHVSIKLTSVLSPSQSARLKKHRLREAACESSVLPVRKQPGPSPGRK